MSTPDPSSPKYDQLRDDRVAKYRSYLGIVWKKSDNCPICDSTYWSLGDLVDGPLRFPTLEASIRGSKSAYVYVPVSCLYCGYTIFFHTGILDTRGTEEKRAEPPLRAPEEEL